MFHMKGCRYTLLSFVRTVEQGSVGNVSFMFLSLSQSLSMIIVFPFLSIMFIDLNNCA